MNGLQFFLIDQNKQNLVINKLNIFSYFTCGTYNNKISANEIIVMNLSKVQSYSVIKLCYKTDGPIHTQVLIDDPNSQSVLNSVIGPNNRVF